MLTREQIEKLVAQFALFAAKAEWKPESIDKIAQLGDMALASLHQPEKAASAVTQEFSMGDPHPCDVSAADKGDREGWQWVPKEPTLEMQEAGSATLYASSHGIANMIGAAYRAMLEAAAALAAEAAVENNCDVCISEHDCERAEKCLHPDNSRS